MELYEKRIERREIYNGRILKLVNDTVSLPNGNTAGREVVYHPGGVGVLAVTDASELLLVRQYRYPFEKTLLEIPAGKLDKSDSKPIDCGIRELKEETGAVAKNVTPLGKIFASPGYSNEIIYLFKATGLEFFDQHLDKDEFLNVIKMPFDTALEKVYAGEICDAKTVAAILHYALETRENAEKV